PPASPTPTTVAADPGVVVAPVPSTAPPAEPASAAGAPATVAQPQLARTGANTTSPAILAVVLFLAGAMALVAGRRRSRVDPSGGPSSHGTPGSDPLRQSSGPCRTRVVFVVSGVTWGLGSAGCEPTPQPGGPHPKTVHATTGRGRGSLVKRKLT